MNNSFYKKYYKIGNIIGFFALMLFTIYPTKVNAANVKEKELCKFEYINIVSKKKYDKKYIEKAVFNLVHAKAIANECKSKLPHYDEGHKLLTIIKKTESITLKEKTRYMLLLTQYGGASVLESIFYNLNEVCYYETEMMLRVLAGLPTYLRKEFQKLSFIKVLALDACQYPMSVKSIRTFNEFDENLKRIQLYKRYTYDGNEPITFHLIQNLIKRNAEINKKNKGDRLL